MSLFEERPFSSIFLVVLLMAGGIGIPMLLKESRMREEQYRQHERRVNAEQGYSSSGATAESDSSTPADSASAGAGSSRSTRPGRGQAAPSTNQPLVLSDRLEQARKQQYSDPAGALAVVEAAMATPANDQEHQAASELLPDVLSQCFYKQLKADEYEGAKGYLDQLISDYPQHHATRTSRRSWEQRLVKRWYHAVRQGQSELAHSLTEAILESQAYRSNTGWLGDYQKKLLDDWERAIRTGRQDEAAACFETVARTLTQADGSDHFIAFLMRHEDLQGRDLLEQGDWLVGSGRAAEAVPFFVGAFFRLNTKGPRDFGRENPSYEDRQALRRELSTKVISSLIALGEQLEDGETRMITLFDAGDAYESAMRFADEPSQRIPVLERALDKEIREFLTQSEAVLAYSMDEVTQLGGIAYDRKNELYSLCHDARAQANRVLNRTAMQLWECMVKDPQADPWSWVPQAIVERVAEKYPAPDPSEWQGPHGQKKAERFEKSRRDYLCKLARDKAYPLPLDSIAPAQQRMCEVMARWGLAGVDGGNPEEAFQRLRFAVRGSAGTALQREIGQGVCEMIRQAVEQRDFDSLYGLTGFYVAEIADWYQDRGFQQELLSALQESIEYFESRSTMKTIFLTAVVAESFPGQSAGQQARKQAMEMAFEAVTSRSMERSPAGSYGPSGRSDLSVHTLDNSTDYQLMVFYDGPERFFVRCGPRRRGTVLLENGTYHIAVIVTSDDILPWHGEVALAGEWKPSVYRVQEDGSDPAGGWWGGSSAYGDYELLYAPAGMADVPVNPKNGSLALEG